MKLFLDENITKSAKKIFEGYGYDVVTVQSLGIRGQDDPAVFNEAQRQQRIFITHNGRDFVILVPPRLPNRAHKGIIWLKYEMTKVLAPSMCKVIHDFLGAQANLDNIVYTIEEDNGTYFFNIIA